MGLGLLPYNHLHSQSLPAYLDSIQQLSDPSFIHQFPFEQYSSTLTESPASLFVKDIDLLDERQGAVHEFMDSVNWRLMQKIQKDPGDYQYMLSCLRLGEALMHLDGMKSFIYPAFGDLILQGLTTRLDEGLAEGSYSAKDKEVQYLIRRLRENRFFVNVPVSDWDKGFDHLKNGNFTYLLRKVRLKQPLLFYGGISAAVFMLGLGFWRFRIRRQRI